MQAALERQKMVGTHVRLPSIHGHLIAANSLLPHALSLSRGTVLLLPFTLCSPSIPEVARDLAQSTQQTIYAITSWQVNTGREDVPSSKVVDELRAMQRSLPRRVLILIVPNEELGSFHADTFPAGIAIHNGVVVANTVLSGKGAERLLINDVSENSGPQ
jgi:hypothetical protein